MSWSIVRADNRCLEQRDTVRVVEWTFRHWTPFNGLTAGEASSPGYRHAIERQHTKSDLPYGLDVSHREKVLSILWTDDGSIEMANLRPLRLGRRGAGAVKDCRRRVHRRETAHNLYPSTAEAAGGLWRGAVRVSEDGITDRPACIGPAAGNAAG
jgi:hypothetical protein